MLAASWMSQRIYPASGNVLAKSSRAGWSALILRPNCWLTEFTRSQEEFPWDIFNYLLFMPGMWQGDKSRSRGEASLGLALATICVASCCIASFPCAIAVVVASCLVLFVSWQICAMSGRALMWSSDSVRGEEEGREQSSRHWSWNVKISLRKLFTFANFMSFVRER